MIVLKLPLKRWVGILSSWQLLEECSKQRKLHVVKPREYEYVGEIIIDTKGGYGIILKNKPWKDRIDLDQWSPTFLAPRNNLVEDRFSMDRIGGMVHGVMWEMGSGRWSFTCLPLTSCCAAAHFLLWGWVPHRLGTPAVDCKKLQLSGQWVWTSSHVKRRTSETFI